MTQPTQSYVKNDAFRFFYYHVVRQSQNTNARLSQEGELYLANLLYRAAQEKSPLGHTPHLATRVSVRFEVLTHFLAQGETDSIQPFRWKELGDAILFQVGYFPEVFKGHATKDFYISMGQSAYRTVAQCSSAASNLPLGELAEMFEPATDIITELRISAEDAIIKTPSDELALRKQWVQTGNEVAAAVLSRRGHTLEERANTPRNKQIIN